MILRNYESRRSIVSRRTMVRDYVTRRLIVSRRTMVRPHYLPRELSAVILTAVYKQPRTNATTALRQLSDTVTKFENDHPDAVSIVAGDFNHTNMKTVLPKYYQHVSCPTRGDKILDHCYSTIKNAYRSMPRPHYGRSDHSSVSGAIAGGRT